MTHQVALTICAPVAPERLDGLRNVLDAMAADAARNPVLPFAELPATHFARLVIIDGDRAGTETATLVLTLDCDAPAAQRLQELAGLTGAGVDQLFGHCVDYPAASTPLTRIDYLRAHLHASDVFYVHSVGRTLAQIHDEAMLRRAVEEFVDGKPGGFAGRTQAEAREAIRGFVAGDPTLAWALEPAPRPALSFRIGETVHKIAVPAALLVTLPLVVPAFLLWLLALRRHETTDPFPEAEPDPALLRVLGEAEDFGIQNAFTSLAPIRAGRFWRLTSILTLLFGNYSARHIFTNGGLAGLSTVHFARFMRFGPAREMLFTSYYDGSLESYNNDFVDQVAWVLNTVFGQQHGYPRTRWMIRDGARDERGFKAFIRGRQIPTQVWYSAYPDLAAVTIDQNARFRAGLSGRLSAQEVETWLRLL